MLSLFGLQTQHFCASGAHVPLSTLRSGSRNVRFSTQISITLAQLNAFFVFLFLLFSLLGSGAVQAEEALRKVPASVVAIVDVQRVLQESSAASGVKDQVEARSSQFQKQIAKEENSLRKKEKDLAALRETANAEEYAKAEQALRERFLFVERHVQARRKALDQAYNKAMQEVRGYLISIVKEAAQKQGINLVVVKQQVIWNDQVVDITDVVLSELNKRLPKIRLQLSQEEGNLFEK